MHTGLQSAILDALRARHPEAMTDVQIWAATDGYECGGHGISCVIACFELEKQGRIQSVEGGKKWKLADTGTPVPESHLGEVGQPEAGAGRKTLLPSENQVSQPTEASSDDVPQSLSAESMSCGERAATGKDEGAATSRKANGRQIKIARQDCGSVEAFPRIPQVSSIPDGAEGDDRAAGQILLSPEFHAVHIADEGANSTRAWWGELEREAQEALAGEMAGIGDMYR